MRLITLFALLTVLMMIADRLMFVIFPNFLLVKNLSATEIGIIFSIASFILILSRTLIGKVSDSKGRKHIMSIGFLVDALSTAFFPSAVKLYHFTSLKVLKDVSETLVKSVENAIIADSFPKKVRVKAMTLLGTVYPFSRALAAVIGFIVLTYFSLEYGFYIAALSMFLAFLLFVSFYKEEPMKKQKKQKITKMTLKFKLLIIIAAMVSINFTAAYYPAFFILAKNIGVTENILFLFFLVGYLASTASTYILGNRIEKFGKDKTVMIGLLIFSLLILIYPFSNSAFQLLIILVGVSVSYHVWRIAFKIVLMDNASVSSRGAQLGFAKTIQGIGDIIGPLIGGLLIDIIFLDAAFFFSGVIGLVASGIAFVVYRQNYGKQL